MHVKKIWKAFLYNFIVLLDGPVQNALLCLMDRYKRFVLLDAPVQNASLCLMDRYGTLCLHNGPVPELLSLVHGKELPIPKGWNSRLPTWEPQVTIARNCRFPEVGTDGSQPGNHGLPLQATAGSQRLELMLPNVGTKGYHGKEPPAPRGWN